MRCSYCDHDVRRRDRRDGACNNCGKKFAFEPLQNDPFTDRGFLNAIETLSGNGSLRWGVEHLYWELARRRLTKARRGDLGCGGAAAVAVLLAAALSASDEAGFWPFLGGALALLALVWSVASWRRGAADRLPLERFNRLWERWIQTHGRPPTAIVRDRREARPAEPDLYDYSFDRVVVCDRARTVDLLLANDFHFENNCAVLSIAGYPEPVFEPVRAMLRRNPRLEIFALHDATPFGCRVAYRLARDPDWFKGRGRVVDVGLRPRHVQPHRDYWLASDVRDVEAGGGLSADEALWLSRHRVELAVYRPEAVLRALFRAVQRRGELAMPRRSHDRAGATDDDDDGGFSDSFG